jgi:predicted amidohydrolase
MGPSLTIAPGLARVEASQGAGPGSGREKVGRPVRVVSLSFRDRPLDEVLSTVDREGARGADVIALPETWRGQNDQTPEALDGPTIAAMSGLARKHATYVVCPIDRKDGRRRWNSAVLLDRRGEVACVYDKIYPYWAEFDQRPPVEAGRDAPVHQADFGRVGLAICFDVNFPEVWQRLADRGAELVVWPSAYSAGSSLMAHAINHHFYIVTSTLLGDCLVFDITGKVIHDQQSRGINVSRVTLDLDRGIYHQNFNIEKRDRLLREHGDDVEQEQWLDREQWFVLRAKRPGVSARGLARQYGLEELHDYIGRSRRAIDRRRGSRLAGEST